MTQPREIIQGATYLLTRRVLHRRFLLRPDANMTEYILYSLAVAAGHYEIQVHAICAMSTHIHMVVTDPKGVLPRFLRKFHHLVAMGVKSLRKWEGAVWDNARTSVVRLITPEATIEKIAYALANPVTAGSVERASQWPGAKNLVEEIGADARHIARPNVYFSSKGSKWPARAELQFHVPPTFDDPQKFRNEVARQIADEEKKALNKKAPRRNAKKYNPATISPYKRATSRELPSAEKTTFAVELGNDEAYKAAEDASKTFRLAYRNALARWRAGDRSVRFPQGTWWMHEFHAANVSDSVPMSPH